MTKGYQRGARRPDPTVKRDKGARKTDGYQLGGGIPWPELGDGSDWTDATVRVQHKHVAGWTGRLQSVEWCHPDGSYMPVREKVRKATKTMGERREPLPGCWYGQVSWDEPDRQTRPAARQKLAALVPESSE